MACTGGGKRFSRAAPWHVWGNQARLTRGSFRSAVRRRISARDGRFDFSFLFACASTEPFPLSRVAEYFEPPLVVVSSSLWRKPVLFGLLETSFRYCVTVLALTKWSSGQTATAASRLFKTPLMYMEKESCSKNGCRKNFERHRRSALIYLYPFVPRVWFVF